MVQLRPVSARPELVVSDRSDVVGIPTPASQVGVAGPLWRERVLYALPLNGRGPVQLAPGHVLQGTLVGDPANNVIGVVGPLWVHRMLYARWTEDTRI